MDRTTKTFETPGGHSVVIYDYITGGEVQEIARIAGANAADTEVQLKAVNHATTLLVRTLDSSAEDLLTRVLALPLPDYQAISEEVQALINPEKKS